MLGLDVSNYSSLISAEWAQERYRDGYRFLIAGTHEPDITRNQLFHASQARMDIECYVYLYGGESALPWLRRAIDGTSGLPLRGIWLDLEDEALPYGKELVDYTLETARTASYMGFDRVGIYTRREWFERHIAQADATKLGKFPLWLAHYDGIPTLDPRYWREHGFGPWWKPTYKQFKGDVEIDGVAVDLNVSAS